MSLLIQWTYSNALLLAFYLHTNIIFISSISCWSCIILTLMLVITLEVTTYILDSKWPHTNHVYHFSQCGYQTPI